MNKKKFSYKIIFESSIIWGRPLNKDVVSLIKEYRKNKKIIVEFYAPELVVEEAKKHLLDDYSDKRKSYNAANKDLNEIFLYRTKPSLRKRDKRIFEIVDRAFSSNGIKILKTPVSDIRWKSLIGSAAYKRPPFNPGKDIEKGFKDAVIAETVLVKLPRLLKNSYVIFLCNDGLLTQYLKEKTRRYKRFKILPSITDIKSSLRLNLLEIEDKLKEELTKQAEVAFYKPLETNTLFQREEVQKKLFEKFPTLLVNPKIEDDLYYGVRVWNTNVKTLWVPIGGPNFEVSTPEFLEKKDNIYIWESTIVYRQMFENQETAHDPLYANFSHRGEYRIEFKVKWQSELTGDKIIAENCKTIEINDTPKVLSGGYDPMRRYALISGATIAGQGTVQVVEPLGSILAPSWKWCSNCNQYVNDNENDGLCPTCGRSLGDK